MARAHLTAEPHDIPERQIPSLVTQLQGLSAAKEDDIRIYPLPRRLHMDSLGRQSAPAGLALLGPGGGELLSPGRSVG